MDFVHHHELIALAQIAVKVDVSAEHVGELHRHAVGNAGRVARCEQRAADDAGFHRDVRVERRALLAYLETRPYGEDLHQGVARGQEAEGKRLAIRAYLGGHLVARPQPLQGAHPRQAPHVLVVNAEPAEKGR
jgi:hypothetical protein